MFTVYTQSVKTGEWEKGRSFKRAGYAKSVARGIIECGLNAHLVTAAIVRDEKNKIVFCCRPPERTA